MLFTFTCTSAAMLFKGGLGNYLKGRARSTVARLKDAWSDERARVASVNVVEFSIESETPWPGGLCCGEERLLIGERRREFGHALDLHVAVLIGDVAPGLG